jgi:hypothetical protein
MACGWGCSGENLLNEFIRQDPHGSISKTANELIVEPGVLG